jgi:hypothetical protein
MGGRLLLQRGGHRVAPIGGGGSAQRSQGRRDLGRKPLGTPDGAEKITVGEDSAGKLARPDPAAISPERKGRRVTP